MKLLATLLISVSVLAAQNPRQPVQAVTAVRHWSLADITRVAVEVSGEFEFRTERLHNPERVYFDILNARPRIESRRIFAEDINDKLVSKLRVAETRAGVTRIVLDLSGSADASTSQLSNPNRLIIELRPAAPAAPAVPSVAPMTPLPSVLPPAARPDLAPPARSPSRPKIESGELPPAPVVGSPVTASRTEPILADAGKAARRTTGTTPQPPAIAPPIAASTNSEPVLADAGKVARHTTTSAASLPPALAPPVTTSPKTDPILGESSKAARHTTTGSTSLVRALGLKLGRVVIDAGHGGHDNGTQGAKGLLEKDLVLDISKRVGKLIEEQLGAEVVYTRSDDTFIPLESRTAIATDKKADLFLSIHANSSPVTRIAGVETYYRNFTNSKDALDVAARENSSSQKSIAELETLIQKVVQGEKVEESREFAARIQTSLYAFSARNFPGTRDRGVKKAPFVVLIGAKIPSVLVEVGFLSNPREEALLRKSEYRQKLAEALFRGISRYADSLSHFQVAKAGAE
jgi:N-acetylmuramoyl-L-alanine amidase